MEDNGTDRRKTDKVIITRLAVLETKWEGYEKESKTYRENLSKTMEELKSDIKVTDDKRHKMNNKLNDTLISVQNSIVEGFAKLKCGEHEIKISSNKSQINRLWVLYGGIIIAIIAVAFKK